MRSRESPRDGPRCAEPIPAKVVNEAPHRSGTRLVRVSIRMRKCDELLTEFAQSPLRNGPHLVGQVIRCEYVFVDLDPRTEHRCLIVHARPRPISVDGKDLSRVREPGSARCNAEPELGVLRARELLETADVVKHPTANGCGGEDEVSLEQSQKQCIPLPRRSLRGFVPRHGGTTAHAARDVVQAPRVGVRETCAPIRVERCSHRVEVVRQPEVVAVEQAHVLADSTLDAGVPGCSRPEVLLAEIDDPAIGDAA